MLVIEGMLMKQRKLSGQMSFTDLSKIYRKECLFKPGAPCNIFYAHDVAIEIGMECSYGCCRNCKELGKCGAACNNRYG